jgi:hypothetical protein
MIKNVLSSVFISIFCFSALAQHEADKWHFGTNAEIDFTSGSPVVGSSNISTAEGCSAISSSIGKLLMYTDGQSVWDSTGTIMTNGTGLNGDVSSTQSALIVPSPSNSNQFYIFTTDADADTNGFSYSIVDLTLGAHGDVMTATKNTRLLTIVDEKIAAIRDVQGGYWILAHTFGDNNFYSYHLTVAGLQPPVVSGVGMVHSNSTFQNAYGQLKFNMCGDKLACAIGYMNTVEVFDFDQATGIVSSPLTIPFGDHVYGVEFSRNSTFLYATSYDVTGTLCQYNITLATLPLILSSRTPLTITDQLYGLQMAPAGKIYVSRSYGTSFLGAVNFPDISGSGCNYVDNALDLDPLFLGHNGALTLPGFVQSFLKSGVTCAPTEISETTETTEMLVFPNPSSSEFTLNIQDLSKTKQIEVYDYSGRLIEKLDPHARQISFGNKYADGLYFIIVRNNDGTKVLKVVKGV